MKTRAIKDLITCYAEENNVIYNYKPKVMAPPLVQFLPHFWQFNVEMSKSIKTDSTSD